MANVQRKKNDMKTEDRREMVDDITQVNRERNDAITADRRKKADKIIEEQRTKNDEMTSARRKANDRNPWRTFAIWLLIVAVLALGAYYFLYLV